MGKGGALKWAFISPSPNHPSPSISSSHGVIRFSSLTLYCFLQKKILLLTKKKLAAHSTSDGEAWRNSGGLSGGGGQDAEDEIGSPTMRTAETLLRVLPTALCVAALVIMLKDSQTNEYGSLSYLDIGAFRYLVHASGVCAGYSLLSAVVAAVPRPTTMSRAWVFFILDQLLTYIILAAAAVSAEVVYLAYKGDKATTWSEACGSFGGFCRKATASIAMTLVVTPLLCWAFNHLILQAFQQI